MQLTFSAATETDVPALTEMRNAATERLTRDFGQGHWSGLVSERGVLQGLKTSLVLLARTPRGIIATLRLTTRKPWAIDPSYFSAVKQPLYLVDMAVAPRYQRRGVGRRLLEHAVSVAETGPTDALRLDAYDAEAGAGEFYVKCGFREVGRAKYRQTSLVYLERILRRSDLTGG